MHRHKNYQAQGSATSASSSIPFHPRNISKHAEIEFLLVLSNSEDGQEPEDGTSLVQDALSQEIQTTCSTCGMATTFRLPLVPYGEGNDGFHCWQVALDESLNLCKDEVAVVHKKVKLLDIELKSRIMYADHNLHIGQSEITPDHTHEITYAEEIKSVLAHLQQYFNTPGGSTPAWHGSTHKRDIKSMLAQIDQYYNPPRNSASTTFSHIMVNETCGLHVHVGNGRDNVFPLQTVKNAMSTYVANERLIDNMHAVTRIGGCSLLSKPLVFTESNNVEYETATHEPKVYNSPSSSGFIVGAYMLQALRCMLALLTPDQKVGLDKWCKSQKYPVCAFGNLAVRQAACKFDRKSWVFLIHMAQTIKDLRDLQDEFDRNVTVNLQSMEKYSHGTIEFRQHAGTLDGLEIVSWIDFVTSLVRFSHDVKPRAFQKDFLKSWLGPRYQYPDLLTQIDCKEDTKAFYKARGDAGTSNPADFQFDQVLRHLSNPGGLTYYQALRSDSNPAGLAFEQALREINSLPEVDPLRTLAVLLAWKKLQINLPAAVEKRIHEKFLAGGYGQFSGLHMALSGDLDIDGAFQRQPAYLFTDHVPVISNPQDEQVHEDDREYHASRMKVHLQQYFKMFAEMRRTFRDPMSSD